MALPKKVTKLDAAWLLEITRPTLDRRIEAGVYSWPAESLQALVREHVEFESGGRVDSDEAKKLIATRRRKLEIEIKRLEGGTFSADEVRAAVGAMISSARARLLAIPNALAQALDPDQPARAYALLEGEIHNALHALADDALTDKRSNGHA
jgi:hypothetical protein